MLYNSSIKKSKSVMFSMEVVMDSAVPKHIKQSFLSEADLLFMARFRDIHIHFFMPTVETSESRDFELSTVGMKKCSSSRKLAVINNTDSERYL